MGTSTSTPEISVRGIIQSLSRTSLNSSAFRIICSSTSSSESSSSSSSSSLDVVPFSSIGSFERNGSTSQWMGVIAHSDRKSTRLNSSHVKISYAVFCLKKKKQQVQ